jgi:large subunit ribosomal protein L4
LKQLARQSALTYKAKENNITVLESFSLDAPKTKDFLNILKNLNLENQKVLFIIGKNDKNIVLSSRNVAKNKVITANDINTYDVLNAAKLVLVEDSIPVIEGALNKE